MLRCFQLLKQEEKCSSFFQLFRDLNFQTRLPTQNSIHIPTRLSVSEPVSQSIKFFLWHGFLSNHVIRMIRRSTRPRFGVVPQKLTSERARVHDYWPIEVGKISISTHRLIHQRAIILPYRFISNLDCL